MAEASLPSRTSAMDCLVISQGKLYYDGIGEKNSTQIVGLDKQGKMIAGNYSIQELQDLDIQEAVTFQPRIIVNGKGQIKSQKDGWGIAPRTAMGQREDGAILFVVIDGRQPAYSIGASLYDVQQVMLDHGAVIAANLDGGSSTVLVGKGGEILNKPSSEYGERYLPTAFLVIQKRSIFLTFGRVFVRKTLMRVRNRMRQGGTASTSF